MNDRSIEWRIVVPIDSSQMYSPVEELWRGTDLADPEITVAAIKAHRLLRRPKLQVHNGKDWYDFNPINPDPRMGSETYIKAGLALLELISSVSPVFAVRRS